MPSEFTKIPAGHQPLHVQLWSRPESEGEDLVHINQSCLCNSCDRFLLKDKYTLKSTCILSVTSRCDAKQFHF